MYTKEEFVEAYVISAVAGSATERGGVDIYVLVLEALEAYDEIHKSHLEVAKRRPAKASQD